MLKSIFIVTIRFHKEYFFVFHLSIDFSLTRFQDC